MRFLVTGGTGFIGSHMVDLILSRGWEAICPVRDTNRLKCLEGSPARVISLDSLEEHVQHDLSVDYVIHVAGATRALDLDGYRESNVALTRRLLDLFSGAGHDRRVKRFVLVSSQAACGPCRDTCSPVCESDSPSPVSPYGRSKLEAEDVTRSYGDEVPFTIVRPCTVFGPRDKDCLGLFSSPRFGIVTYISGPDRLVSVIYVEDLVEGILAAALSPVAEGKTYFLSNPEPVVWREFALLVARVMGRKVVGLPVPLPFLRFMGRMGDLAGRVTGRAPLFRSDKVDEISRLAWICSPARAMEELGWEPATPLEEAIGKTAEWYKEAGWI